MYILLQLLTCLLPQGMGLKVSEHPPPCSGTHTSTASSQGPQTAAPLHRHGVSSPVLSALSLTFLAKHSISTNCLHSPQGASGLGVSDRLKQMKLTVQKASLLLLQEATGDTWQGLWQGTSCKVQDSKTRIGAESSVPTS